MTLSDATRALQCAGEGRNRWPNRGVSGMSGGNQDIYVMRRAWALHVLLARV